MILSDEISDELDRSFRASGGFVIKAWSRNRADDVTKYTTTLDEALAIYNELENQGRSVSLLHVTAKYRSIKDTHDSLY